MKNKIQSIKKMDMVIEAYQEKMFMGWKQCCQGKVRLRDKKHFTKKVIKAEIQIEIGKDKNRKGGGG